LSAYYRIRLGERQEDHCLCSIIVSTGRTLEIISSMPQHGVIFSDGVESDFLRFGSGAIASATITENTVALVYP
jgi:hypothetical protein